MVFKEYRNKENSMKSNDLENTKLYDSLKQKALWVRQETLKIHRYAPGTRIASSLSDVEIFTVLYYGGINMIKKPICEATCPTQEKTML